ncbi:MAG: hypothetical protein AAF432_06525, partial [Planctomycetota bacterium]
MIDLKTLRENPDLFLHGARDKRVDVDIHRLLRLDEQRRTLLADQESARSQQKKLSKEIGPKIGALKGRLKQAEGGTRDALESEIRQLEEMPLKLKAEIQAFDQRISEIEPEWRTLWLKVPQPADDDVPRGTSADDNVELRTWHPSWFDPTKSFRENKGFDPKSHVDIVDNLGLVDFERAVKMAGARHYVLRRDG